MAIPGGKVSEDGGKGVMGQRKEEVRRIKAKGCRGSTVTTQKSPAVQEGSEMCKCNMLREENRV